MKSGWLSSWLLAALVAIGCGSEAPTQTIIRFSAATELAVPDGAVVRFTAFRHGEALYDTGTDHGTFPFHDDIKFPVVAADDDASRRFTVFAELLDSSGARLSWARVRTGFVQDELSEVRIEFVPGCKEPADRPGDGHDPETVAGSHTTCLLDEDGSPTYELACYAPQAFTTPRIPQPSPTEICPVRDSLRVDQVDVGVANTCVIAEGRAFCWGRIAFMDFEHIHRRPSLVLGSSGRAEWSEAERVVDVSVAQMSMCLVTEAGALRCGGRGPSEERPTGIGTEARGDTHCCTEDNDVPAMKHVYNTYSWSCSVAQADGALWCAGAVPGGPQTLERERLDSSQGYELLVGTNFMLSGYSDRGFEWITMYSDQAERFPADTALPPREELRDASGAWSTLCAVDATGTLQCWGTDPNLGLTADPPLVLGGGWSKIAVPQLQQEPEEPDGSRPPTLGYLCGIDEGGALLCWGHNRDERLGVDDDVSELPYENPIRLGTTADWTDVALGRRHGCAIRGGGQLYCWGANNDGQLGVASSRTPTPQPVHIPNW